MKKKYRKPLLQLELFDNADVICSSDDWGIDDDPIDDGQKFKPIDSGE